MIDHCRCESCTESEVPCYFDCEETFSCVGCKEMQEMMAEHEFDVKASQGCI